MKRTLLSLAVSLMLVIPHFAFASDEKESEKPKDNAERLIEAAAQGELKEVQEYLEEGVDPNKTDEQEGQTALIAAAKFGRVEVVKALLQAGAKVDATDDLNGATALMWVASNETEEGATYKPPMQDKVLVTQVLIQKKANVNAQNSWGGTALQWAADAGNFEIVQALVKAGAKVDLADHDGLTPLMAAANYEGPNFQQIVQLLIKSKTNVNLTNKAGETALHFAAGNNFKPDNVQTLLKAGAKVDAANNRGETPLMKACQTARVENARTLVAAGANIHAVNKEGLNVWRVANRAGYKEMVQFLTSIGLKD